MTNKLPRLIGIHGHAGVGKDTVASYLNDWYKDCYSESFADPLKAAASHAFGISVNSFYSQELKECPNQYWNNLTPRKIAQFFGTEMFRENISKLFGQDVSDFWVRRMEGKLTRQLLLDDDGHYFPEDCVVIPDVRFQNEYDWIINNNGVVIHLVRDGYAGKVGIVGHASESGIHLNNANRTYVIHNNGSIGDLYNEVDRFVNTFPYLNLQRKS